MKIRSFGHALPAQEISNNKISEIMDTSDEWIQSHTGISSRYILSGDETISALGAQAAQMALDRAGLSVSDVDYILCSTTCGEMIFPSTACLIQRKLGASCPAVDVNAGCTGFLYALDMADAMLARGHMKHVLVIAAEQITRLADWTDRATSVLFGDAAGAALCEPGDGLKAVHLTAAGNADVLYATMDGGNCPYTEPKQKAVPLQMAGQEIFKYAVTQSSKDIHHVLAKGGAKASAVDHFVLHQANRRILDAARTRLKQPAEKFPMNIETHGNTGSAGIPVLLSEMMGDGRLQAGDTLVLSAFGAGLTSGAALLQFNI
ncbi:MAG TPA: beta-ketoacyl-ACP synthase III [Candidatus Limiplasma sp.]|nr:beta-ketoacyl-ACP synthase III [Candidatus Limiplasma sp.]HRX08077.1 beta-ketoacyl-ACP synthase III [Candidatus Limiplasma sp.]